MDISLFENETANSGIDVEAFEKMNLLAICQIPDPRNYREGSVFGYDSIVKGILADLKRPSIVRMISRAIPEVKKEDLIADELDIERTYHSSLMALVVLYSVVIQLKELNQENVENG
jgi:hypothetical protein